MATVVIDQPEAAAGSHSTETHHWRHVAGVLALLILLATQLAFYARQQSQTFDEACHIFAGYRSWKNFDFGINPEHPPLVKLVATLPLLRLPLRIPPNREGYFKAVAYLGGRDFLYANNADELLFWARLAAGGFTICLALAVFLLAYTMWGPGPAYLSLALLAFEPNIVAHGALVTTDMGVTFGLFFAISCYYFYLKKPSVLRLAAAGAATGVCLSAKHSGIVIFPILLLLAGTDLILVRKISAASSPPDIKKKTVHYLGSLAAICAIAILVLWGLYGFRYSARASGASVNPPLAEFASRISPLGRGVILQFAQLHLLPESYLYGLVDVYTARETPTYLFGAFYPRGQWFYFPVVFLVKSTLPFLVLLLLVPLNRTLREVKFRREGIFLVLPPAIYFVVAMVSGINFGVRHILPVYPFVIVLIGLGAWQVAKRHRAFAVLIGVLIVLHVASSLHAFPNELAYVNELWGGPRDAHRILADSNVDWGQGLKAMKQYIDRHEIKDCWFAYFGSVVTDSAYYGIPCKPLPASFANLTQAPMSVVPPVVDGPVFISASEISGTLWGDGAANPYARFRGIAPSSLIADSILVFDGRIDTSAAAAKSHESVSAQLARAGRLQAALAEAEIAVSLAPGSPGAHEARGLALSGLGRVSEAREEFQEAQSFERASKLPPL